MSSDDPRVFPLVAVTEGDLAELVGAPLASVVRVDGGITNTIHKVTLANGDVLAVKHYAGGERAYSDELAILRRLARVLPVPEIVRADDRRHAIVYRWIDGVTMDECRRSEPPVAFASLAEPLGRLLAWLSNTESPPERWELAPLLEQTHAQLAGGRARERIGGHAADALRRAFDAAGDRLTWGPPCLSHGDIGGRNVVVQRADGDRWRIGGVIDWETAAAGTPLVDIGGLFRYSSRYDAAFLADFERGFREAGGAHDRALPPDWFRTARLLDATGLVDVLDEDRELPGVFADCRMLVAQLIAEVAVR